LGYVALVIVIAMITFSSARAQETELEMRLVRTFGFQAGLQVQGSFSARLSGPENLERVTLFLDGKPIGVDEAVPFRIDFNTGDFSAGDHRLWAVGETASGQLMRSSEQRLIFLTADQGLGSVSKYLLPIFILIGAGVLFSYLMMALEGRHNRFRLGEYGPAGGAVCRRCGMPFSRHLLAPNLLVGKLERCPHCGHWAVVPRASSAALQQAEARYGEDIEAGSYRPSGADDDLQQRLEDSRFED
jgi:hypothetical protein